MFAVWRLGRRSPTVTPASVIGGLAGTGNCRRRRVGVELLRRAFGGGAGLTDRFLLSQARRLGLYLGRLGFGDTARFV